MPDKLLLVDYGGVLGKHHIEYAERRLSRILEIDVKRLRELLSEKSEQGCAFREGRLTEKEFWDLVCKLAGLDLSKRPADSFLSRLWAETYELDFNVLGFLCEIRKNSAVGILTNIDFARSEYLLTVVGILNYVDIYLPSYKLKATKPKQQLWEAADREIKKVFGDVNIIYVDDRPEHINACQDYGWGGIVFESVMKLEKELMSRGFLVKS